MKLYYSPGACSLSPHIVLREAGFEFETVRVDLKSKLTEHGEDYNAISEHSYVPLLVLDSGEKLSEGPAIVQYLADQKPDSKLAPQPGTLERVRLQSWLNFLSTELHKSFSPLFYPERFGEQAVKLSREEKLPKAFNLIAAQLAGGPFLTGDVFSVADAYLYTLLNWTRFTKLDLSPWPVLTDYLDRVSARPMVKATLQAEGLQQ